MDVSGHLSRIKWRSSPSPTDPCANLAPIIKLSSEKKNRHRFKMKPERNFEIHQRKIQEKIPKYLSKAMQEKTVVRVHWLQFQDPIW